MDGVHGIVGAYPIGADIPVLALHHLGPHGKGVLGGGIPELDVSDYPPHQPQGPGGEHLAVGVLDLLLDADIELHAQLLGDVLGKGWVQSVQPLHYGHVPPRELILLLRTVGPAQLEAVPWHGELPRAYHVP